MRFRSNRRRIDRPPARRASLRAAARGAGGQTLVEFALVLSLLVLLLLGVVNLGWMAYLKVEVTNAARAGVQYGAQSQITAADTAGMTAAALQDAPSITGLTAAPSRFCECASAPGTAVACSGSSCTGGRLIMYVRVDTSASYQAWVPYPGMPAAATISGKAVMRVSQ